jgi:uncharacterized damage-inducible protein DinB
MSLSFRLDELLDYSDAERRKWAAWVAADSLRLALPFQQGGRFPTLGTLFDHIFLVERRHLARLEGGTPPDSTGIPTGDAEALFEYADLIRADFRRYVGDLDDASAAESVTFGVPSGTFTMTRRKLALHIVLHEVRHLAQVAYAVRRAGLEPPGSHDLFYFMELS